LSQAIHEPAIRTDGDLAGTGVLTPGRASAIAMISVAAGLMAIGAVMTFSTSARVDRALVGWEFWNYPAVRQMAFVIGGLLAMLVLSQISYRIWSAWNGLPALLFLLVALGLSALVLVPGIGVEVNQARRWLQIGPASWGLRFQPSELIKVALPVFLAGWTVNIRAFRRGFLPVVLMIGAAVGIVGIEDFGTGVLLAAVGGAMLLMAGARWWHVGLLVLPSVPAFAYLLLSRSHRMERLLTFLDIYKDPEGKGYQAVQSLCTIASGGWWGRGLGRGFVKGYLPEARTDFIFAVVCEELGIVGAAAVIGLLIVLMWQAFKVIRDCRDPMGRLLVFGIAWTIGLQAAMNIAVVTVSVPTKGIALPLVSAGGSGAIFLGALVGVMASIARFGVPACPGLAAPRRMSD